MYVTIVHGKIVYGGDAAQLRSYCNNVESKSTGQSSSTSNAKQSPRWQKMCKNLAGGKLDDFVGLSLEQFVRFKNSGRQHASSGTSSGTTPSGDKVIAPHFDPLTGQPANGVTFKRIQRHTGPLEKWDVEPYGNLTGRAGPWGSHAATNRDHLLADSINQLMYSWGNNPYEANSASELKKKGLAVAVSGQHHRKGSQTYGGRVQQVKAAHAADPHEGAKSEIKSMLHYKADLQPHRNKATLRIEMVGSYVHLYKRLVEQGIMKGDDGMDKDLLGYLTAAVNNDDGCWRIDPAVVGLPNTKYKDTESGRKWKL